VLNPEVVDAEPRRFFDRAALRAVSRWKYRPEILEGKPVSRSGVRTVIRFELDATNQTER